MIYNEIHEDLFKNKDEYYLAHCISKDFALGAGIAKEFNKQYGMRKKLFDARENGNIQFPKAILIDNVFNLITKEKYYGKPTYDSLVRSLYEMKEQVIKNKITKLAMPKIGCGLDKLKWNKVSVMIQTVFSDLDIEIKICYL